MRLRREWWWVRSGLAVGGLIYHKDKYGHQRDRLQRMCGPVKERRRRLLLCFALLKPLNRSAMMDSRLRYIEMLTHCRKLISAAA